MNPVLSRAEENLNRFIEDRWASFAKVGMEE
jgi:hypothetical protein